MVAPCVEPGRCLDEAIKALNRRDAATSTRLLQEIIRQFPGTPWEGRAALALGKHYQEQGDPQAVPFLLSVPRHLPLLGDYAYAYLGEALLQAKDFNGAGSAFDLLLARYPDSLLRPKALSRSAEAWFQAEDCMRAQERQARFLAEYAGHALVPGVLLRRGDCQQRGGETAAAMVAFRRVWTEHAASPEATEAAFRLQRLKERGMAVPDVTPQDWSLRAKTLFDAGQYASAVKAFEELLRFTATDVPNLDQARLRLGIAFVRMKQYEDARRILTELVRSRAGLAWQEAVVWLARVFLRQGQDEPLLSLAGEVESATLSGDLRARFLLLLAAHHTDRGRFDQAIGTYRKVGEMTGQEGHSAEASWRTGWLLYRTGRYEEAVRSFDQTLRPQPNGPFSRAALYWKGRSLEKAGDSQNAMVAFQTLCREAPNAYYCQSARLRTRGAGGNEDTGTTGDIAVTVSETREEGVMEDIHYKRAEELRLVGWLRESGEELATLTGRLGRDRGGILWLARLLEAAGDYHRALALTQLFFPDVIERGGAGVPQTFWELAYPGGYWPAESYLIAAVIREESMYNPTAVSSAGALGLMQVMPQTGQRIAARLGLEEFTRERLFDSCYNIRLGSWYLGHLAEKFNNNLIHMIAAYNAGPEVVSKWVQQFGDGDTDEFIEVIPYTETRQYVKKVLRSYREYMRIYGTKRGSRFLDKVC
jgi:soluble lytic murein transglycosylase